MLIKGVVGQPLSGFSSLQLKNKEEYYVKPVAGILELHQNWLSGNISFETQQKEKLEGEIAALHTQLLQRSLPADETREVAGAMAQPHLEMKGDEIETLMEKISNIEAKKDEVKHLEEQALLEKTLTVTHETSRGMISELQTKLSSEPQASTRTIEDLNMQLTSAGEKLQPQISNLASETAQVNALLQSTKAALQSVISKLEDPLTAVSSKAETRVFGIENLKAVAVEKSALESQFEQLEKTLPKVKAQLNSNCLSAAAATVKVAALSSKLQEHNHVAGDRDVLNEKVLQLRKELQATHSSMTEQEQAHSQKQSEMESALKNYPPLELEDKLPLKGGSIDTLLWEFFRKYGKKKWSFDDMAKESEVNGCVVQQDKEELGAVTVQMGESETKETAKTGARGKTRPQSSCRNDKGEKAAGLAKEENKEREEDRAKAGNCRTISS